MTVCVGCGRIVATLGVNGSPHYDMEPHECSGPFCGAPTLKGPACLNYASSLDHRCTTHSGIHRKWYNDGYIRAMIRA